MSDFDPAEHRMVPQQRWFEDFVLGERFVIPSRTMTSAVFAAFQTASGDSHPVHYDAAVPAACQTFSRMVSRR
jgi:acyl dehydratase